MEVQNEYNLDVSELIRKESKTEKLLPDYPIIKVQLPREAAIKVYQAFQTLKDRKSDAKVDEILAEYLNGVSEAYLDDQIDKRTPEEFYFEAARNIPELREKIIQQAKKALQRTEKASITIATVELKKNKKKNKNEDHAISEDGNHSQIDVANVTL